MAVVDSNETFASVAKFITIICILALRAAMNWKIHQMDVKTTFLNRILEVEIYMDQPEGSIQEGKGDLVCKLKKDLYGLKQSPRCGTTISTRSSLMRAFVGAKRIIRCT